MCAIIRLFAAVLLLFAATSAVPLLVSVDTFMYCDCGTTRTPSSTTVYASKNCVKDSFSEYYLSWICPNSTTATLAYYTSSDCQGKPAKVRAFPAGICDPGQYGASFVPSCIADTAVHATEVSKLRDRYYAASDCRGVPVWTDLLPLGCLENCPNTFSYGAVSGNSYMYRAGCDPRCIAGDECGNGSQGPLGACGKDPYSAFYHVVDVQ